MGDLADWLVARGLAGLPDSPQFEGVPQLPVPTVRTKYRFFVGAEFAVNLDLGYSTVI